MSKRKASDSTYKPPSGVRLPHDKDYQLRSVQRTIVIDEVDSGRESEAPSAVGEPERRDTGLEIEAESHIESKPKMSREDSQVSGMDLLARIMTEMREDRKEDRRRQEERERNEEEKERKWREELATKEAREREREDKLMTKFQEQLALATRGDRPAVDRARVHVPTLPKWAENEPLESFTGALEVQLKSAGVPENNWKGHLIGQLNSDHRMRIQKVICDDDTTYDDVVRALDSSNKETTISAGEKFFEGDVSKLKSVGEGLNILRRWAKKATEKADNWEEKLEILCMARMRALLVKPLKQFLDVHKPGNFDDMTANVTQWQTLWGEESQVFAKKETKRGPTVDTGKGRSVTCFLCGKVGHMARECRSKKEPTTKLEEKLEKEKTSRQSKPITCYACGESGHKSTACPQRKDKVAKRVATRQTQPEKLEPGDMLVKVNGHYFPATMDTGATVSVVPKEFVREEDYTGETETITGPWKKLGRLTAPVVEVSAQVGDLTLVKRAVVVEGNALDWVGIIAFTANDMVERQQLNRVFECKDKLSEEQLKFVPPKIEKGVVHGAIPWEPLREPECCEKEQNSKEERENTSGSGDSVIVQEHPSDNLGVESHESGDATPESNMTNESVDKQHPIDNRSSWCDEDNQVEEKVEEKELGLVENVLVAGEESSGDVAEEGGQEDSADRGVAGQSDLGKVVTSTQQLRKYTLTDESLTAVRKLADKHREGYEWENGLLYKCQKEGRDLQTKRLCLPKSARERCLTLTHEQFGHRGYRKVAEDLGKLFYWPSLWRDVRKHCQACEVCQRHNKGKPRRSPMCEREVLTVPSERVCVDLVGPLPKGKGGVEYILTYIDVATRWPEAVPLRSTTAQVVIRALTEIFSRNGFPGVLVSDNGPQFISKTFKSFCEKNGINHVRTAIYSPESNGIVERFHGSLKSMLAKCREGGGSWPELLPMVLFFLRMTPSVSSSFSPFLMFHGWEPNTPARLLYNAWVSKEVGNLEVEQWVRENTEKVQALRDEASAKYREVSADRKDKWDKNTSTREFKLGQLVWYRSPGLNEALQPSWEGPYEIKKLLGPLTYQIEVNGRVKCTHISFLKNGTAKQ